jgi:hypothetical protein
MLPTCQRQVQMTSVRANLGCQKCGGGCVGRATIFPVLGGLSTLPPAPFRHHSVDVEVCLDSSPAECAGVGSGFCCRSKPIHCRKRPANSPIGSEERGSRDNGSEQEQFRGRCPDREEQWSSAYAGCASRSGTSASAWRNGFPVRWHDSKRGPCEGQAGAQGFSRTSRAAVV